jgi:hypothetical protein
VVPGVLAAVGVAVVADADAEDVSVDNGVTAVVVGAASGTVSANALIGKDKTKNKDMNIWEMRFFIIGLLLCNKIRTVIICNTFVSGGKALA